MVLTEQDEERAAAAEGAGESSGTSNQAPKDELLEVEFVEIADVRDPESIEENVEWVRQRVATRPREDSQIKTPDAIIRELDVMKHAAGVAAMLVREADKTQRAYRREAARARAIAARRATGKDAKSRELQVEVMAAKQIEAADAAEIAYSYARSIAQLVYEAKSAVQTQAKQVEIQYQLAGRGER